VSFEVFTLACDHNINVGGTVGMTNKCVVMARCAAPCVGVCGGEDDMVRIGLVVMEPLPDAT
jgi:hypothetical protein